MRQAIAKSLDNAAIKALVFPEGGDVGENHHVAPIHPEYFALPPLARDVEGAKALLAEAGKENLEITIDIGNTDGPWHQAIAEAMRDQAAEAGITLNVNVMPASKYWEIWTSTPFGGTAWTHRPLGTMILSLGLPHRRRLERDRLLPTRSSTRRSTRRRRRSTWRRAGRSWRRSRRSSRTTCRRCYPIWRPVYTFASNEGAQLSAAPDPLSPVQQGLDRRLTVI